MPRLLALAALCLLCSCHVLEFGQPETRGASDYQTIALWNANCGSHHFASYPAGSGVSFAQAYSPPMFDTVGFAANFAQMKTLCYIPDVSEDDEMDATLLAH